MLILDNNHGANSRFDTLMQNIASRSFRMVDIVSGKFVRTVGQIERSTQNVNDFTFNSSTYLDFLHFVFPSTAHMGFFKSSNNNSVVQISFQTWSKPLLGVTDRASIIGHTYYFGSVCAKYDIFLVFKPNDGEECRCCNSGKTHVDRAIANLIGKLIDNFFALHAPHHSGYYSEDTGETGIFVRKGFKMYASFEMLRRGELDFSSLSTQEFFRTHSWDWVVSCLGQNDAIREAEAVFADSFLYFDHQMISKLKFAIAINVAADSSRNDALSVILPKEGIANLFGDDFSTLELFPKCFQKDLSNIQSPRFPVGFEEHVVPLHDSSSIFDPVSINFYNGMFI